MVPQNKILVALSKEFTLAVRLFACDYHNRFFPPCDQSFAMANPEF
jgi:hypothetical protein